MARVYRVVTQREDGSIVGFDGPFRSPGVARSVLRTVSKGLWPSNPSGAVKAKIQEMDGEWVDSASQAGARPRTTGFDLPTMLEPELTKATGDQWSKAGWKDAGYTSLDNPKES